MRARLLVATENVASDELVEQEVRRAGHDLQVGLGLEQRLHSGEALQRRPQDLAAVLALALFLFSCESRGQGRTAGDFPGQTPVGLDADLPALAGRFPPGDETISQELDGLIVGELDGLLPGGLTSRP